MLNKNERMAQLNKSGVDTSKYFTVNLDNGTTITLMIDENGKGTGNVFYSQYDITIRCGAPSKPSDWYSDWNVRDYDYDTGEITTYYTTYFGQER